MNALTKLFRSKPAKKSLKAPVTLFGLFAAAILFSPGCECTGDPSDLIPDKVPEFLSLNVADGFPSAHTKVEILGLVGQQNIALGATTGTPTPTVKIGSLGGGEYVDATYTLSPTGDASILDSYPGRAYAMNLSACLEQQQPPGSATSEWLPLSPLT